MSILTSKPQKRHAYIDPIFVLLLSALVLLLFFAVFTGSVPGSVNTLLGSSNDAPTTLSTSSQATFAGDQQYWEVSCKNGWSADSGCDSIVTRVNACSDGVVTAYCTEYRSYLQEYRTK